MTLEQAIAYIQDDELVEVTPEGDPAAEALPRSARAEAGEPEGGGRLAAERSDAGAYAPPEQREETAARRPPAA